MKKDIERLMKKLADKKIREFLIGFETIGPDLFHYANDCLLYPFKMLLPAKLGGGRFFYHTSAFFKVEGEYDYGIVVEYGGKAKGGYLPSRVKSVYNIFEKYKYGMKVD